MILPPSISTDPRNARRRGTAEIETLFVMLVLMVFFYLVVAAGRLQHAPIKAQTKAHAATFRVSSNTRSHTVMVKPKYPSPIGKFKNRVYFGSGRTSVKVTLFSGRSLVNRSFSSKAYIGGEPTWDWSKSKRSKINKWFRGQYTSIMGYGTVYSLGLVNDVTGRGGSGRRGRRR